MCAHHLDRAGKVADSPADKKQKAATTLLRDEIFDRAGLVVHVVDCSCMDVFEQMIWRPSLRVFGGFEPL